MSKKRVVRTTKSGSYTGYGKSKSTKNVRGKAVPRLSNAQHKALGTLQSRNRAAAHKRKRGWL